MLRQAGDSWTRDRTVGEGERTNLGRGGIRDKKRLLFHLPLSGALYYQPPAGQLRLFERDNTDRRPPPSLLGADPHAGRVATSHATPHARARKFCDA